MSDTNTPEPDSSAERRLGKSWRGEGAASSAADDATAGPWLFLGMLGTALAICTVLLAGGVWLLDRAVLLPYPLARVALFLLIIGPVLLWWICYVLCLAAVVFRSPMHALPILSKWAPMQAHLLIAFGRVFGVSRDRIGSSCLAVTNVLALLQLKPAHAERPIILLPRCMAPDSVEAVREAAKPWGCPVYVMESNEQARRTMQEANPTCVITAACERDLLGGLFDFGAKLPILAIANRRPDGPCFGTHIEIGELEEALGSALGTPKEGRRAG